MTGNTKPDPYHIVTFCRETLVDMLTSGCRLDAHEAAAIGEDVLSRANSFAALEQRTQDVLTAPFAEEVFGYEPAESPLRLKGAVTVVVRNSLLEEAHAHGPVEASGIRSITTIAAAHSRTFWPPGSRSQRPVPATTSSPASPRSTHVRGPAWQRWR